MGRPRVVTFSGRVLFAVLATGLALGLGLALWPGEPAASGAPPAETPADGPSEAGPRYSPFVLHVQTQDVPFHRISFKDVGLSVAPEDRAFVYESIAQSLAQQLAFHAEHPLSSQVVFTEEITDPDAHRHCEGEHIYVDLWQSGGQQGWGYSLWSGCGPQDRFQLREVPAGAESPDDAASLTPLTQDIARSLHQAIETDCFTKTC